MRIDNPIIYDSNNSIGLANSILASNGIGGVTWIFQPSGTINGIIAATQIPIGNSANSITGISTFIWSNGLIGIGTIIPSALLTISSNISGLQIPLASSLIHVVATDETPARITIDTHNTGSPFGSLIQFRRSRGSAASPLGVATDDVLMQLGASGYYGQGYTTSSVGIIAIKAAEAFTITNNGTYVQFFTTPIGFNSSFPRVIISPSGSLGIGTTVPLSLLHVQGNELITGNSVIQGVGILTNLNVTGGTILTGYINSGIGINTVLQVTGNTILSNYINSGIGINTNLIVTGVGILTNLKTTGGTILTGYINSGTGINTNINVTGIATMPLLKLTGAVYDINSSSGISSQVLTSTGTGTTWKNIKRSIVTQLMTAWTPTSGYVGIDTGKCIVPYDPNDGTSSMTLQIKRLNMRVEQASSFPSGITTINLQSSVGGMTGIFTGLNVISGDGILKLFGTGTYGTSTTTLNSVSNVGIVTSGMLLAVNWVGIDTTMANFTIDVLMREV